MSSLQFQLITLAIMGLGIAGIVWMVKRAPQKFSFDTRMKVGAGFGAVVFVGLVLGGPALFSGGKVTEGIAARVDSVELRGLDQTILHLATGEADQVKIACRVEQKACRAAQPGDIVLYDIIYSNSGLSSSREVRFVTPGP